MNLAERVKAILQNPKSEWLVIESEPTGFAALFVKYTVILAAIPPVCALIGAAFTGYTGYRIPFGVALKWALIAYGLSLLSVLVTAFVIDALAVAFGAQRDFNKAMKVSVYAPTAAWAAGIFTIQPPIAFLFLTGLYSFYLLYTGLAALMKPPPEKLLTYTIAVVVCVAVLWSVILGVPVLTVGLDAFG
jgi:hypothetical protein